MATIFGAGADRRSGDYCRRISNHLAFGLVVFAMFQILIVAMRHGSTLANIGIIVVIAALIPSARAIEHRWQALAKSGLSDHGLEGRCRAEALRIWAVALLVPLVWIPLTAI